MYVVFKQGVYRHNIQFVTGVRDNAVKEAKRLVKEDNDDYHEFCLGYIPKNGRVDDLTNIQCFSQEDIE